MNAIAQEPRKLAFSQVINSTRYSTLIANSLPDPALQQRFKAGVITAVAQNPQLSKCTPESIIRSALTGAALGLSPSPQLGQYYLVPRKETACFQLGYRGLVALALRSGQYRRLNVVPLKEGELVSWDPLSETAQVNIIMDGEKREAMPSTGYIATMELTNGFRKTVYWSRERVEQHARRYSAEYRANGEHSMFWGQQFDAMACKTVLRDLISHWGIVSADAPVAAALEEDTEEQPEVVETVEKQDETIGFSDL